MALVSQNAKHSDGFSLRNAVGDALDTQVLLRHTNQSCGVSGIQT